MFVCGTDRKIGPHPKPPQSSRWSHGTSRITRIDVAPWITAAPLFGSTLEFIASELHSFGGFKPLGTSSWKMLDDRNFLNITEVLKCLSYWNIDTEHIEKIVRSLGMTSQVTQDIV